MRERDMGKNSPVASAKEDAVLDGNHAGKRSVPRKASTNFRIDALAFLTLLITTVSGMALMRIHPGEHNTQIGLLNERTIWGLSIFEWQHLHNIIGWLFVALVVIHLVMHRRWIASMLSR